MTLNSHYSVRNNEIVFSFTDYAGEITTLGNQWLVQITTNGVDFKLQYFSSLEDAMRWLEDNQDHEKAMLLLKELGL